MRPPASTGPLKPQILQFATQFVVACDGIQIAVQPKDSERPCVRSKRDGRIPSLQSMEGVARDPNALRERERRELSALTREADSLTELADLLRESRE
jgi:hypothetical protein